MQSGQYNGPPSRQKAPFPRKLDWITLSTKEIIWVTNEGGPDQNYGKSAFFAFCNNNHPKTAKRQISIWKKGTLSF